MAVSCLMTYCLESHISNINYIRHCNVLDAMAP